MFAGDLVCAREVGDGSADLEDSIVGAGGQVQFTHRHSQQILRLIAKLAVLLDLARLHPRVAGQPDVSVESFFLKLPCGDDPLARRTIQV